MPVPSLEDRMPDPEFVKERKEREKKMSKEFHHYLKHKKEWQKEYDNTFIAIKGFKVVMHGDDQDDVIQTMLDDGHELGTFLVHRIADDSDVPIRFCPRPYVIPASPRIKGTITVSHT